MNTRSHPTPSACIQQSLNSSGHPFLFGHPAPAHTSKQDHGSTQHSEEMMHQNHSLSDEWKRRMFSSKILVLLYVTAGVWTKVWVWP